MVMQGSVGSSKYPEIVSRRRLERSKLHFECGLFHNVKSCFILTSPGFYLQCLRRQAKSVSHAAQERKSVCPPRVDQERDSAPVEVAVPMKPRAPVNPCRKLFVSFSILENAAPRWALRRWRTISISTRPPSTASSTPCRASTSLKKIPQLKNIAWG